MPFKKMRTAIDGYRAAADTLDPRATDAILTMLSSASSAKRMRRLVRSDPQLAVALFLLDLERDNGITAAQFNESIAAMREEALAQGVPQSELEPFLAFHLRHQLLEQGIKV